MLLAFNDLFNRRVWRHRWHRRITQNITLAKITYLSKSTFWSWRTCCRPFWLTCLKAYYYYWWSHVAKGLRRLNLSSPWTFQTCCLNWSVCHQSVSFFVFTMERISVSCIWVVVYNSNLHILEGIGWWKKSKYALLFLRSFNFIRVDWWL